tara:strand:+ start:503 stop:1111 length:609 start_codon:yes stop_codon:yes gene_type:complete
LGVLPKDQKKIKYMEKLTGKIKTCVFISGRGSNLKSIVKNSRKKNFPAKIELVISNNPKAKGLLYAKKNKIPYKIFKFKNRKIFELKTLKELKKRKIKLICLAGFMKILSKNFIKSFKYKILNVHPSLLPKYKGLNTHERVISNKEKFSGCTVHLVSEKLDSGKIIVQKKVKVSSNDNPVSLSKKIIKIEHQIYPLAIKKII